MAVAGIRSGGIVAAARFGIEQDGGDHRLHIAAHARAIVLENLGDALNVSGTWIAGHKMLDQLARNERRKIWMIEDVVDGAVRSCAADWPPGNKPPDAAFVYCSSCFEVVS